ncbi:response regulator transcription factor [Ignavigranum ruoffiae]|uniref:response regulator transcription factor n=1 Tax=Ignavigranum ruoffiae TaxID=89093 RepID=UPI002356FA20|nr:response regulator transcription factor [Ignavigranum ruoffiae]
MNAKLLLIEDDPVIGQAVQGYLINLGYQVDISQDYLTAKQKIMVGYSLIILDLNLPDGDGLDLLPIARKQGSKVVITTVKNKPRDIVTALDQGADDYLTKPFDLAVLRARIDVCLRQSTIKSGSIIKYKSCSLNTDQGQITYRQRLLELTALEYEILAHFILHPQQIFTRQQLLARFWDQRQKFVNDNTLTATIKRIRDKSDKSIITTVRGIGYRME